MRTGIRRNGQSDPHTQRAGVNVSISAATNGSMRARGSPTFAKRNGPESLTKCPSRPNSSSARNPGWSSPRVASGLPQ